MSTILLAGVGPLPCYRSKTLYGFGIRTWQFLLPLLADGHRVILVTFEFGQPKDPVQVDYREDPSARGDVVHIPVPEPNDENREDLFTRLRRIIREHQPDCIVTAGSTISSSMACGLSTDLPIWADLFGDLLAEAQAKSAFAGSEQLNIFHRIYLPILRRGDMFSSVSDAQRFATLGQLGVLGRLDHYTLGYPFVRNIPCAYDGSTKPEHPRKVLRGSVVSDEDFVVLCSGGFNTWADVDTLFLGLDTAMAENPAIHVVVTGGGITGHHEAGFDRFTSLVNESSRKERYHLMGWIPTEEVDACLLESDLGVNVDLDIAETLLGSRNRFLSWIRAGLPILTTVVSEISQILHREGLCFGVDPGNLEEFRKALLYAADHRKECREMARQARLYGDENFTFEATTRPLRQWVTNPKPAPDTAKKREMQGFLHELDREIAQWLDERKHPKGILRRIQRTFSS